LFAIKDYVDLKRYLKEFSFSSSIRLVLFRTTNRPAYRNVRNNIPIDSIREGLDFNNDQNKGKQETVNLSKLTFNQNYFTLEGKLCTRKERTEIRGSNAICIFGHFLATY
jgi:hypothetical protein